jgi:hypothetical protein
MILSDMLGLTVLDPEGAKLGRVIDARFRLEGHTIPARARLTGLIVSPRSASSYLGYERRGETRPAVLGRFLRWRHRGSFLVAWADIARIDEHTIKLRPGFERGGVSLED